ncbi:MAG: FHIPEP family type III secretion protein [Candidatus Sericytochromatia bacterium]|nr:FHIPEP family type III secretion protein [Candidatus Sericytochromatia bacterium]
MSIRNPLALVVTLGLGAVAGAILAQPARLPLGPHRGKLDGPAPSPDVEVVVGSELAASAGELRGTVGQMPRAIREDLGFAPSHIHWRESVELEPHAYQLRLRGLVVGSGRVHPGCVLALETVAGGASRLPGERHVDPVSGRTGVWVDEADEGPARLMGCDVLHPGFALALHLEALLRRNLADLLTREETHRVLDVAAQQAPRTVKELLARVPVPVVQGVLAALLREQVSLRQLPMVLEAISDAAAEGLSLDELVVRVRLHLGRYLTAALVNGEGVLEVIPLGDRWQTVRGSEPGAPEVDALVRQLRARLDAGRDVHERPVLLAPHELRLAARRLLERELPDLPVLSEREVDPGVTVVRLPDLVPA